MQAAPTRGADSVNPGTTPYALSFTANCQALNWRDAEAQGCSFDPLQGMCGNWAAQARVLVQRCEANQ